jgi:hypothetical protein
MSMHGADVQELRRLSSAFIAAADEIDNEGQMMTRVLNNVSWLGDVATRFAGHWTGQQLPRIGLSTNFLREAAEQLARNADEQEQTSSAGIVGISSPPDLPLLRTLAVGEDGSQPPDWRGLRTMRVGEDGSQPPDLPGLRTMRVGEDGIQPPDLPGLRTMAVGEDGIQPPDLPGLHTMMVGEDGSQPPDLPGLHTMAVGEDGSQPPDLPQERWGRTMAFGSGEDGNEPIDMPPREGVIGRTTAVGEDGTQPPEER